MLVGSLLARKPLDGAQSHAAPAPCRARVGGERVWRQMHAEFRPVLSGRERRRRCGVSVPSRRYIHPLTCPQPELMPYFYSKHTYTQQQEPSAACTFVVMEDCDRHVTVFHHQKTVTCRCHSSGGGHWVCSAATHTTAQYHVRLYVVVLTVPFFTASGIPVCHRESSAVGLPLRGDPLRQRAEPGCRLHRGLGSQFYK